MRVSVVVPARNEERFLPACLEALRRQTLGDFELIVVDSASSDRTGEIARAFGARVIRLEKPGVSRARQAGFEAAKGDVIASTDADTIVPPDWLERLTAPFSDPQVVATISAITYGKGYRIQTWVDNHCQRFLHRFGLPSANAVLAVRRWAFDGVNGFYLPNGKLPQGFPELEAMWLGLKLRHVGKIVLIPELRVLTSPRRLWDPRMAYWWTFACLRKAMQFGWWELTRKNFLQRGDMKSWSKAE